MPRWGDLSRLTKSLVALLGTVATLGAPVVGLMSWADGRYFPKTDGERLIVLMQDTQIEVRIGQFITRETALSREKGELLRAQTSRALSGIEMDRLFAVEAELVVIRERIVKLRDKLGKNGN